jgi:hypothetical protein
MKRALGGWKYGLLLALSVACLLAVPLSAGGQHASPRAGATAHGGGGHQRSGGSSGESGSGQPQPAHAVPRTFNPAGRDGTTVVVERGYTGGFYPWGYGGLGFGFYGYGASYDPWFYGGGYQYGSANVEPGALRLKVKPREAQVSVDGFYVGIVDDFDGIFERLHLEAGPHRVDINAEGYEPLTFDVQVQPGRTTTYTGALLKRF